VFVGQRAHASPRDSAYFSTPPYPALKCRAILQWFLSELKYPRKSWSQLLGFELFAGIADVGCTDNGHASVLSRRPQDNE